MRFSRGQASIEYLGIVALIALVLGALVVPALAGADVAGAVVAQVRRALCVVSGGDCEEDRRPCAVDTHGTRESQHVNIGFFRYGQDRLTMRETRSDGTVAVTVLKDHRLGLDAGIGVDAHAGSLGFGASVRGALLARLGSGTTAVFPTARDADRGMALLSHGRVPPGATRVRLARGGLGAELEAIGGQGNVHVADDVIAGRSVDESSGRTTYSLRGSWEAQGALGLKDLTSANGDVAVDVAVTLTKARDGRFIDLGLEAAGSLYGSASIPKIAGPIAGLLPSGVEGGRRWTLEQHLDLTDAGNRAAAAAFVDALGHPKRLPGAGAELARRFVTRGVTDVRAYRFAAEDDGAGAHIGAGGKFGAADDWHVERAHLLAALQRGPDGIWRHRSDCLLATLDAVRA